MISNARRLSRPRYAGLICLLVPALALGSCTVKDLVTGSSRLEGRHEDHSQDKSKIQLLDVALTPGPKGGDPASVFQLRLRNSQSERLWTRLVITSPREIQGCDNVYELEPVASTEVQCPQRHATKGAFALELIVYDDVGNTHVVERAKLTASFGPDGTAQLEWE